MTKYVIVRLEEGVITGEQIGDCSPMEEGMVVVVALKRKGTLLGEQIGDGSPVEEGNGIGGSC